jgi:hypothetical protein
VNPDQIPVQTHDQHRNYRHCHEPV